MVTVVVHVAVHRDDLQTKVARREFCIGTDGNGSNGGDGFVRGHLRKAPLIDVLEVNTLVLRE